MDRGKWIRLGGFSGLRKKGCREEKIAGADLLLGEK